MAGGYLVSANHLAMDRLVPVRKEQGLAEQAENAAEPTPLDCIFYPSSGLV